MIVLASASPRRKKLLEDAGVKIKVCPSTVEEQVDDSVSVEMLVESLAEQKASDVAKVQEGIILGADTVVVLDGEVLGKPKSMDDARLTLGRLSGRTHLVITGYCVIYGAFHQKKRVGHVVTRVTFNSLSKQIIDEYVATGSPMDKAGSYGIQDGFDLVKEISGSLSNVIGLPTEEILQVIKEIENEES